MAPKPVRMYLMLLFVAVAGVGLYLIYNQYNTGYDEAQNKNSQSVIESTPTPTVSPTIDSTSLNTTNEAAELEALLSDVPSSDFDESLLDPSSLGI